MAFKHIHLIILLMKTRLKIEQICLLKSHLLTCLVSFLLLSKCRVKAEFLLLRIYLWLILVYLENGILPYVSKSRTNKALVIPVTKNSITLNSHLCAQAALKSSGWLSRLILGIKVYTLCKVQREKYSISLPSNAVPVGILRQVHCALFYNFQWMRMNF